MKGIITIQAVVETQPGDPDPVASIRQKAKIMIDQVRRPGFTPEEPWVMQVWTESITDEAHQPF